MKNIALLPRRTKRRFTKLWYFPPFPFQATRRLIRPWIERNTIFGKTKTEITFWRLKTSSLPTPDYTNAAMSSGDRRRRGVFTLFPSRARLAFNSIFFLFQILIFLCILIFFVFLLIFFIYSRPSSCYRLCIIFGSFFLCLVLVCPHFLISDSLLSNFLFLCSFLFPEHISFLESKSPHFAHLASEPFYLDNR